MEWIIIVLLAWLVIGILDYKSYKDNYVEHLLMKTIVVFCVGIAAISVLAIV